MRDDKSYLLTRIVGKVIEQKTSSQSLGVCSMYVVKLSCHVSCSLYEDKPEHHGMIRLVKSLQPNSRVWIEFDWFIFTQMAGGVYINVKDGFTIKPHK